MVDAVALGTGIAALVLLVVWTAAFSIAHIVRPTTWLPWRNAVSEYGVLPHKTAPWIWVCWWTIAGVAWLLVGGISHIVYVLSPNNQLAELGLAILGIFGVARILTSIFPTDVSDNAPEDIKVPRFKSQGRSRNGILHLIFAFISFASIVIASIVLGKTLAHSDFSGTYLGRYSIIMTILGILEAVSIAIMAGGRRCLPGYFGLLERIFYATHIAWFYATTTLLIQTGAYDFN